MDISINQFADFTKVFSKIILYLINNPSKRKGFLFIKDADGFCSKVRKHGNTTIEIDNEEGKRFLLCSGCFFELVKYQMNEAKIDMNPANKLKRQLNIHVVNYELKQVDRRYITAKEAFIKYQTFANIPTLVLEQESFKILKKMLRKKKVKNVDLFVHAKTLLQLLIVQIH